MTSAGEYALVTMLKKTNMVSNVAFFLLYRQKDGVEQRPEKWIKTKTNPNINQQRNLKLPYQHSYSS